MEGVELHNIVTGEDSFLPATGVFVAIGHAPNTDVFGGQLEMDEAGYLITAAESTETNVPACSPAVTSRITPTGRPSRRPVPAAWLPSTPNGGWRATSAS